MEDIPQQQHVEEQILSEQQNQIVPTPKQEQIVPVGTLILDWPKTKPPKPKPTSSGKFGIGNKSGGSIPYHKEIAKLRKLLFTEIDKSDWVQIKNAFLKKCKEGDYKCIALLFSYTIGKPVEQVEISTTASAGDVQRLLDNLLGITNDGIIDGNVG